MGIANIAGTYDALYGAWWCDPPGGALGQILKS